MSKKNKEEIIDFLYMNENENELKLKKKRKSKNKNAPKKTASKNDIINLDNEIIIGLTPKPASKKTSKQKNIGGDNKIAPKRKVQNSKPKQLKKRFKRTSKKTNTKK